MKAWRSITKKASENRNDYGQIVEEYEIQFIDGETIDAELFKAIGIHQGMIGAFFDACEEWEEHQKINVIIAVGEAGYVFDFNKNDPDDFDVDLYEMDSLRELAFHFVDEGLLGDIPEAIAVLSWIMMRLRGISEWIIPRLRLMDGVMFIGVGERIVFNIQNINIPHKFPVY